MPWRTLVLLVVGLVVFAGCSSSFSSAYTTQATAPTATAATTAAAAPTTEAPPAAPAPVPDAPPEPIVVAGAGFDLHTAGRVGPAAFDAAWSGVLDTLNRYLDAAILTPLRTGGPAGDLAPFFTPLAVHRVLSGPDRFAFIDEGLPPASDLRKETAVATLTALAGADGVMSVVAAGLDLRLSGRVNGAPLAVVRTGELVLLPEGGTWRIDAYDVKVTRTLSQASTTTTARW